MKISKIKVVSCVLILVSWPVLSAEITPAELLKSPPPLHSEKSAQRYQSRYESSDLDSGMVELVFMVDKTGKPAEIAVVRSTMSVFEHQALLAISRYRYRPAVVNSEPVVSRQNAKVEFDHSRFGGSKVGFRKDFALPMQASDRYMSHFNKLTKELKKDEPNERKAFHTLHKMKTLANQTFFTGVQNLLAQYRLASRFESKERQLEPLHSLLMYEDVEWDGKRALDVDTKTTVQFGLVQLMIELGQYAEALEKYSDYSEGNPQIIESFSASIQRIKGLKRSDNVLERTVTISHRGSAFLSLLKRSFVVDPINGEIDKFKLRCAAKYAEFAFKKDEQYQLPESWGQCQLQLIGRPDSTVSVLQQ